MEPNEIIARLKAADQHEVAAIARRADLPYETVRRLRAETKPNPRLETLNAIAPYFKERDAEKVLAASPQRAA